MKSCLILLLPMQRREFRHSGVLRGGPHPTECVAAVPAGGGGPGLVLEVRGGAGLILVSAYV